MNQFNDQNYYISRAAASRQLAQCALDPAIAAIHTDFACRYDLLAMQCENDLDRPMPAVMTGIQAV